ncbi:MAG: hypothetical protein JWQ44_746 [Chthoniobacter sp.]|nr:hypothetical protein [Chthoniobacter sp.]
MTATEQEQLTTRFAERAVAFIDRHKDAPFFLYLTPNQPHVPLFVSDKFRGKSERGLAAARWRTGREEPPRELPVLLRKERTAGAHQRAVEAHPPAYLSERRGQTPPDGGKPIPYREVRITEPELYDLSSDREEKTNVAARNQDVVARLLTLAEKARAELGDSLTGRTGSAVREPGRLAAE